MNTVSAIIPVYNVEKYLSRCLDSVVSQTIPFDRIILVNDGSTDNCKDICYAYSKKYHNIQIVNKENGGLVSAWMEGLKYVDTSHICFIDSDDFVTKDYLETLLFSLTENVDMVSMQCIQFFDDNKEILFKINGLPNGTYDVNNELKGRMLCDKGSYTRPIAICRWGKIIRTDLVKKYANFCRKDVSYGEDQQLLLGIILGCKKISIIDEYKYYYQYNNNSILHSFKKNLWSKMKLLMNTISYIPGIQDIPDYQKQFNTQYLIFFSECLRNESYNRSLKKEQYISMVTDEPIQIALKDYYNDNLRKIDKIVINNAKSKRYLITYLFLELYKLIYKIKKIPG